jgi:mono/diheme cytochrome c family protein
MLNQRFGTANGLSLSAVLAVMPVLGLTLGGVAAIGAAPVQAQQIAMPTDGEPPPAELPPPVENLEPVPDEAPVQEYEMDPGPLEEAKPPESKTPDIENGLKVARTLCTSCHLIGEPIEGPSPADVPTFKSIANRPGQSMERLTNWLIEPHPPMPNPNLTRVEIRDLAGYILSLKATAP